MLRTNAVNRDCEDWTAPELGSVHCELLLS